MKVYAAPWGKPLIITSTLFTALAVAAFLGTDFLPQAVPGWALQFTKWILPAIILGCLPFMVRSYTITSDAILIRRLFWNTRLERASLKSAEVVPSAMRKSFRTCGNGGGFSFTGWYWSKALGSFHAYVTDLGRTVVLRFDRCTVVLSPDAPEDFVNELNRR